MINLVMSYITVFVFGAFAMLLMLKYLYKKGLFKP
jgi:hypothetical protein